MSSNYRCGRPELRHAHSSGTHRELREAAAARGRGGVHLGLHAPGESATEPSRRVVVPAKGDTFPLELALPDTHWFRHKHAGACGNRLASCSVGQQILPSFPPVEWCVDEFLQWLREHNVIERPPGGYVPDDQHAF